MQFVMEKVSQDAFYANLLLGLPEALGTYYHIANIIRRTLTFLI